MLFLDGLYVDQPDGATRFQRIMAPGSEELSRLATTLAERVGRYLERQGLLERDVENSYLAGAVDDDPLNQFLGYLIGLLLSQ